MKSNLIMLCLLGLASTLNAQDPRERHYYYEILDPRHEPKPLVEGFARERVTENLNRGLTVTPARDGKGIYLSWRLLASDVPGTAFHVYREADGKARRLTKKPLTQTCDFMDVTPAEKASYWVEALVKGKKPALSEKREVILSELKPYTSIPLKESVKAGKIALADLNGDGRDEILLGSCMLDDNGTLLWSSGLGHSDKAYLCKLHPDMEGMQVFMVSEPKKEDGRGVSVVDATTGKLIWKIGQTTYHVGDGMVADFDSSHPGMECFASEDRKGGSTDKYLLTADGKKINTTNAEVPGCRNWIWWDADLLRETFKGDDNRWGASSSSGGRKQSIWKWQGEVLTEGIEGDILMIADLEGDWREELITALPGELRIYHTNIPARDRRVTLMQDPLYRSYVAHRSMGYPQAPVPSFYLGE